MISKLLLQTTLFFSLLIQLSLSLFFKVPLHVLSHSLTVVSPLTKPRISLRSSGSLPSPVKSSPTVWHAYSTILGIPLSVGSLKFSLATHFRRKVRAIENQVLFVLLSFLLVVLDLSRPYMRKIDGIKSYTQFLLWSQGIRRISSQCEQFVNSSASSPSITASAVDEMAPAPDVVRDYERAKPNVILELSGTFTDIPITPPPTTPIVLSPFTCLLSPIVSPTSTSISTSSCLSPLFPSSPAASEWSTLVSDSPDQKHQSKVIISTLSQSPKSRQPLADLPILKIKLKSKSKSSPVLLEAPECKFQTSSSSGKENQPPEVQNNQTLQSNRSHYRKDTFMAGLKMNMIPIGEGGFGQVFRATARENKTVAIKLMQRGTVTQEIAIVNEVKALKAAKGSPWAVQLVYYQAVVEQALIGLTYLPGGDMHSYWERSGFCIDLDTAIFYIAQLVLAIHDLHCRGIIHRDVKLENMMLDSNRNLKLVDFGLAQTFDHNAVSEAEHPLFYQLKRVGGDVFPLLWATDHNPHQTNLANGTEGYAPPEVWKCQMHSFGIDYFAMGCALHMLITGNAPFEFNQTTQDYKYDSICVDKNMDLDAYDFLLKVLAPRPLHRLNLRRMKMHPVFRAIDWSALSAGKIEAPYPRGI
ncbi:hypothetical protein AGABI2DRAFT_116898 [Agaricus bisporus var. bisporus H97]|uniref:hypothetical protein n=1 Tax=Agaricus bisporus var. bisporus (strain H97 / ATCC MYA-4626 / FGSC 10389) TaxID=936046 RepID=UPI00029F4EB1|nr:hypothetical protein AGABI2DRAFT_116898 [Agaricus bisporus var. bisporus H97]EKV48073.1 hypothetical protein AGABI2DRAFT_116898 [Agaricus bisporus var. bisporus H97]